MPLGLWRRRMSEIHKLEAMEILDSRGNPTLAVTATLSSGVKATAKVPSGASTGKREAAGSASRNIIGCSKSNANLDPKPAMQARRLMNVGAVLAGNAIWRAP